MTSSDTGPATDPDGLANLFTYHPPTPEDIPAYERIREAGRVFAEAIVADVPPSRERSTAIAAVREAVMWANAGRACNPPREPKPIHQPSEPTTLVGPPPEDIVEHAATQGGALCGLRGGGIATVGSTADVTCEDCRAAIARAGTCTSCGRPAWPHPYRHPITTTGAGR